MKYMENYTLKLYFIPDWDDEEDEDWEDEIYE